MNARALLFLLAVASIAVSATPVLRGLARAATKADAAVAVAMVGAGAGAGAGAWAGAGAGDDAAPGAVLSVSQKGITCWVNELTGKISDLLGNVNVPDQEIHFSHGDVQLSNMHTHDLGGQEFSFSVTPAPGVEVSAKFTVHFAFNFHYNVGGIAGNGQCEFTFVDSSVAATAALGADGSQFALTASDASMQLGSLQHDCNGITGSVLNVLLDAFNSQVMNLLQSEATSQIKALVSDQGEKALEGLRLDFSISSGFAAVRFDPLALTYDKEASALVFALRGDVVQTQDQQDPPGTQARALPPWDSAFQDRDLQVALSQWSLQTAFFSYQRAGHLGIDVLHTAIPASSPLQLRTLDFALVAPGLVAKYGESKWMRIAMALEEGTAITMEQDTGLRISGPAGIIFQVETQAGDNSTVVEDAFALRLDATLAANVSVVSDASGSFLSPTFTALSFPAKVANSTVGPVLILGPLVNLVSVLVESLGLPLLNSKIAPGFPVPSSPQVTPSNSQVAVRHQYLVMSSDLQLNA